MVVFTATTFAQTPTPAPVPKLVPPKLVTPPTQSAPSAQPAPSVPAPQPVQVPTQATPMAAAAQPAPVQTVQPQAGAPVQPVRPKLPVVPTTSKASSLASPKIVPLPQPFAIDGKIAQPAPKYDRYNESDEIARLMEQPPGIFVYNDADFTTVMRALADQARMSFVVPPQLSNGGAGGVSRKVTAAISGLPPYEAMKYLAESQGFGLNFQKGIWMIDQQTNGELIAKTYQIYYNPHEVYDAQDSGGGMSTGGGGGGSSGGSSGGGSSPSGLPSGGVGPQFTLQDQDTMKQNIEAILGTAGSGSGSNTGAPQMSIGGANIGGGGGGGGNSGASQVVYNPDESSFFVIATKQQHEFVAAYIASADKPQKDLAIETKFFETSMNPKKELGIDWSGTLAGGYKLSLTDLKTTFDMNQILSTFTLPTSATLTAGDVNVAIKALLQDSNTELVSYPRVITTSNREVVIRSVIDLPVLASNTTTQTTTTTNSQQIQYLPVGTVINVLPKLMPTGSVRLRVTITISTVTGEQQIQGNTYPITSSRIYSGEAVVNSGYTMAIGGLEETKLQKTSNKVAALGDIPFFGYFFRSRTADRDHRNLMFFITPTVLDSYAGGLKMIPDTIADTRSEENNPDNSKPNWKNWANQNYLSGDTPVGILLDRGLLNALQNTDAKTAIHSELFSKAVAGPVVVNQLEYPFNKAPEVKDVPPLDPTPDLSKASKWPLELIERYLNFFRLKTIDAAKERAGYNNQLGYLDKESAGADRNKQELINDRKAKVATSLDSAETSVSTDMHNIDALLKEKVRRFGELVSFTEMLNGDKDVMVTVDQLQYLTRDELNALRTYGYGADRKYQTDIIRLLNGRRTEMAKQIKELGAAQRALGLQVTTEPLQKNLDKLTIKVDSVEAKW